MLDRVARLSAITRRKAKHMSKAKAKTDVRATIAQQFYDAFEQIERNEANEFGDKKIWTLKDRRCDENQWMVDAIRECHDGGELLPNDWIYEAIHSVLGDLTDREPDSWEDSTSEIADSNVDVYNADRTRWLASHLAFGALVDEAVEELGQSDQGIFGNIGIGQYVLLERIAHTLISAIEEQAKDSDDAE